MDEKYMAAEEVLKKYGQEHLLSQYEKLSEENKSKLLDEILTLDFNQIEELYKRINQTVDFANSKIEPIGYTDKSAMSDNELKHYEEIGLKAIKEGKLAAVICVEDPLREEAVEMVRDLKKAGIRKVVMMTGDSNRTARAIAARVGVDRYFAEVLPEDKAHFVEKAKANGSKVIMIGDGINDSPALSAADVGIAISDGAEIAREIADVTVGADNLYQIVTLKQISNALMKRIHTNYRRIVAINAGLIVLGVAGVIQPTTSALLHNSSTLVISLESMKNLLEG